MLRSTTAAVTQWLCRAVLSFLLAVVLAYRFLNKRLLAWAARVLGAREVSTVRGKRPEALKCMSLVISQTDMNERDTTKAVELIGWCLALGLEYLFVFDPQGWLKSRHETLVQRIARTYPQLRFETEVGWRNLDDPTATEPGRGGCSVEGIAKIHFLERSDSVAPLLHVAGPNAKTTHKRTGFKGLKDVESYWSTDLSIDDLRDQISDAFGESAILEPEVLCIAGPVFSLASSPPWHARFSEIYYLGPLHELHFDHFTSVLSQYWNTHQRFGT